jgi:hypothetical protein
MLADPFVLLLEPCLASLCKHSWLCLLDRGSIVVVVVLLIQCVVFRLPTLIESAPLQVSLSEDYKPQDDRILGHPKPHTREPKSSDYTRSVTAMTQRD